MKKEINEIIEKNLPAQVGQVLRERLEKADKDEALVSSLRGQIEVLKKDVETGLNTIKKYGEKDSRNNNLDAREKAIKEGEIQLKVDTLEYQLESEKDKTKHAKELAMGLVRNTAYRKELFDTKTGPEGLDQYGNVQYATHTIKATETKTEE
jgi:hypothetical protein